MCNEDVSLIVSIELMQKAFTPDSDQPEPEGINCCNVKEQTTIKALETDAKL